MKIAVVGSPKYSALWKVEKYVERLPVGTVLLLTGVTKVDAAVRAAARGRKLAVKSITAGVDVHPNHVDLVRYTTLAKECESFVAFWDGKDKEVLNALRKAVEYGRTICINPEDTAEAP